MRVAVLLATIALLWPCAFGQNTPSDPDVPVLKRRPAPGSDNGAQKTPATSPSPAPPTTASPEPVPPEVPAPARPRTPPVPESAENSPAPSAADALSYAVRLTRSGGVLRVTVTDPEDTIGAARLSIRLRTAAAQFARGDFNHSPLTPAPAAGIEALRQLRNKIIYTAHAIEDGAELIISSQDLKGVQAIHQFLQSQQPAELNTTR